MVKFVLVLAIAFAAVFAYVQVRKPPIPPDSRGLLVTTSAPTPSPVKTTNPPTPPAASPTPSIAYKTKVLIPNVPFTSQAPFAEWKNPRFQEGCEEASSLMAVYWVRNLSLDKNKAKEEIIAMSAYEAEKWDGAADTSAKDTALRIITGYFNFTNYEIKEDISLSDIKSELLKGNLVIVPANGRALNNPHFTAPGPDRHMIVIRGYDDNLGTFITNDPGIKEGELYTYPQQLFFDAIRDYPTGTNVPIVGDKKVMIVVKKS